MTFPVFGEHSKHMIEVHGAMQVGGQVFRRKICRHCDKPALYQVAGVGYCKDHHQLAIQHGIKAGRYSQMKRDQVSKAIVEDVKEKKSHRRDGRPLEGSEYGIMSKSTKTVDARRRS